MWLQSQEERVLLRAPLPPSRALHPPCLCSLQVARAVAANSLLLFLSENMRIYTGETQHMTCQVAPCTSFISASILVHMPLTLFFFKAEYTGLWECIIVYGLPRWLIGKERAPPVQETEDMWVPSLGREDPLHAPLEEEMATHSSILVWGVSWTQEPGRL